MARPKGRRPIYKDPKRLEVRLSGAEYEWLYRYAQRAGVSMTLIARKALHREVGMPLVDAED